MLKNDKLLKVLKESFKIYLKKDSSRSTAKLKSLHGSIAQDLLERLGNDYSVQSQGIQDDKEGNIQGRYYPKKVDIVINYKCKPVAGVAIKFVMRNYSQNSNNYFENMLGETANIRSNDIPYFQIIILFDTIPYYKKDGQLKKYEIVTQHHIEKYMILSKDNPNYSLHTPNKTLLILLALKNYNDNITFSDSKNYAKYYLSKIEDANLLSYSKKITDEFGNSVILNDYEDFIQRTTATIQGRGKK